MEALALQASYIDTALAGGKSMIPALSEEAFHARCAATRDSHLDRQMRKAWPIILTNCGSPSSKAKRHESQRMASWMLQWLCFRAKTCAATCRMQEVTMCAGK